MLMLERAAETVNPSECNDPAVLLACSLGSDSCPAACRDNGDETEVDDKGNVVVKSGDLSITATAATERKAIATGISDLDTITLRTSEDLTVNSITLERYGYSKAENVTVWLEDAYGNKIADAKDLSTSKDTVTLKIKKDYREMAAGENNITTVVQLSGATVWGTIGFKVTDVESSAKNVNLSDYSAYTYDIIGYNGSTATVNVKGNNKDYNYEANNFYEVSRLKVKAGTSAISVNGITLTNVATWTANKVFDVDKFVSKVEVTADGKAVNGLKYNLTKDNEIVMSFDNIDIDINKDVQFVVSIAMDSFDEFQSYARLVLADEGDLKATEKKTGARITVTAPKKMDGAWKYYKFAGSKIKFTNTKLSSTIDAAQGSDDVVIAKGTITVGEEVKIPTLTYTLNKTGIIEEMKLVIAWEEFDAKAEDKNHGTFTFTNVNIEKSGDFELIVDIYDEDRVSGETVKISNKTSIGRNDFAWATYVDSKEPVYTWDVSGSISISQLRVQESKATLKNSLSKTVEFTKDETSDRVTVFKGTYTAKKANITLKEFAIAGTSALAADPAEFYVYVDGKEVGNIEKRDIVTKVAASGTGFDNYESFSEDIEIEAEKSVEVEVKAVMQPTATSSNIDLDLYLRGEDKNGTAAGKAKAALTTFKFVVNGSLTISDSTTLAKKTVALEANEVTLAKFTLKPSKSDSVKLDNLVFDFGSLSSDNITVEVDWTELDVLAPETGKYWSNTWAVSTASTNSWYVKYDGTDVNDIDAEVEVIVKATWIDSATTNTATTYGTTGAINITLASVNGVLKNSTYTRLVLPAIVSFDSMTSDGAVTKFKVAVEDYDWAQIRNLKFWTKSLNTEDKAEGEAGTVTNWMTIEVSNQQTAEVVNKITFEIVEDSKTYHVLLTNTDFPDFFKTANGTTLRVSKVD